MEQVTKHLNDNGRKQGNPQQFCKFVQNNQNPGREFRCNQLPKTKRHQTNGNRCQTE